MRSLAVSRALVLALGLLAPLAARAAEPSPVLRVLVPQERAEAFMAGAQAAQGYPGFDYEVLEGFAKLRKARLEVEFSPTWDGLVPALLEGRSDVVAGGFSDTAARRQKIDFSSEVFPSRDVVVTRKPQPAITTVEALRAARVVTHRGTSMAEALLAAGVPPANVTYITEGNVADVLRTGKAQAGVLGLEVAMLARQRDPELQLGLFLGQPGSLAYGLRKGDAELKAALDGYLLNLRRSPTWGRLVVKYFGGSALEILKAARGQ